MAGRKVIEKTDAELAVEAEIQRKKTYIRNKVIQKIMKFPINVARFTEYYEKTLKSNGLEPSRGNSDMDMDLSALDEEVTIT